MGWGGGGYAGVTGLAEQKYKVRVNAGSCESCVILDREFRIARRRSDQDVEDSMKDWMDGHFEWMDGH